MNRKYLSAISLFGAMALTLASCGSKNKTSNGQDKDSTKVTKNVDADNNEDAAEQIALPVRVTKVEKKAINKEISCTAVLEGWETMTISPSVTGIIEKVYKDVGQSVAAGELLARMDQTQLNAAKLAYANIQTEFQRMEALLAGGNTTQQQYDAVKLQLDQAKTNLDFLQKNTFVKAESAGVVAAKNYENGELYNGARGILQITQVSVLKTILSIPETYFPTIKKGMKMEFTSDIYPGKIFAGVVETVYPTIDAGTHTFQIKVRIPNTGNNLRPGMYVKTNVNVGKVNAIVIPYMSVQKLIGSNNRFAFIADGNKAKRVDVVLGERVNEDVAIESGDIKEGDMIVSQGQGKLTDGALIEIVTDNGEVFLK